MGGMDITTTHQVMLTRPSTLARSSNRSCNNRCSSSYSNSSRKRRHKKWHVEPTAVAVAATTTLPTCRNARRT